MNKPWSGKLKKYVEEMNKTFVDGNIDRLYPFYQNEEIDRQEATRWIREHQQLRSRGATPTGSTTKATLLHSIGLGRDYAEVGLSLHHQLHYLINNESYKQETHRLQRVQMKRTEDDWAFLLPWGWYFEQHQLEQSPFVNEEEEAVVEELENFAQEVSYGSGYHRERAVSYAEKYWNSSNPTYIHFTDDCTNFISQCLHAGDIQMNLTGNKGSGWWYRAGAKPSWSYSWTVAHSLYTLLRSGKSPMRAVPMQNPSQLEPGDIICYDFDGDGRWQHNTMVVAKDNNNMPLVNAHTTNSRMRYWEYRDSTAYTPNIKHAFFQIRG